MRLPTLRSHRRPLSALATVAALAVATACTAPGSPAAAPAPAPPNAASVDWSVADAATVAAGAELSLDVHDGSLTSLVATDAAGHALPSVAADAHGTVAALPAATNVRVVATVVDADGRSSTVVRTVRTGAPPHALRATVTPGDDATVGVGQPVIVAFSSVVRDRAVAERALSVRTDRPIGNAGWYWISGTQVQYRPEHYWPAGTHVTVTAALTGIRTGDTTWGVKDTTSSFTIGRSQILRIDDATHQMRVVRDGADVRTVPVSLGQHQGTWTTRSGIKTIMAIERTVHMDSSTVGITGSGAYDEQVPYAMRLTWSGEYVHGAPWSEWAQGKQDVSHGCTNVSLANGRWLFENSLVGDPVETVGTDRTMEVGNGWGGGWNLSWRTWHAGSALA